MFQMYVNNVEWLKAITVFIIGISVASEIKALSVIAAVLGLFICFKDRNIISNIKNKFLKSSIFRIFGFVVIFALLCIVQGNYSGLSNVLKFFEKITSILLIYIFIGKINNVFLISTAGIILGLWLGESTVFYQYLNNVNTNGINRVGGIYGNPNNLGAVIELIFPVIVYTIYKYSKNTKVLISCYLSILTAFVALVISGSRGAMMAVLVEFIAFVILYFFRKNKLQLRISYIFIFIFLLLGILYCFLNFYSRSYDMERILIFTSAWQMFLDHPFIGIGLGKWGDVYTPIYISSMAKEFDIAHAHNAFLYVLAETGIIGFTAFFSFIYYQFKTAINISLKIYSADWTYINIADMFAIIILGMIIHNMVDVYITVKFYLLIYLFIWGICCLYFEELLKKEE